MVTDKQLIREYRIKRLQRVIEYSLMFAIFLFFLLSFREYYRLPLVLALGVLFFGMNFQLTLQRERRRMTPTRNRKRLMADMTESLLFLGLIVILWIPGATHMIFGAGPREHYSLIAAILCGIFLGGLSGEVWFQMRRFVMYSEDEQRNYIENLKRTIILPYFKSRKKPPPSR